MPMLVGVKNRGKRLVDFTFNVASQGLATWQDRSEKCADLITGLQPRLGASATLADVGCGDRKLAAALERRALGLDYSGFDLRPQSPETTLFDANTAALPGRFDVVTAMGVIEYLGSVEKFFESTQRRCRYFVVSHVAADMSSYTQSELDRLGWAHHMSCAEVENLLTSAGFSIVATSVTDDRKTKLWMCRSDG